DGTARVYAANGSGGYSTTPIATPHPFPGFTGDVRVATGDFNGDGFTDTVLVTGPGTKTLMAVVSGKDGSVLVPPTDPFGDANFTFDGFVAAGDIDRDGRAERVGTPERRRGRRTATRSSSSATSSRRPTGRTPAAAGGASPSGTSTATASPI